MAEALAAGQDVLVDNTNPSPAEWRPLIEAARRGGAQAVAYFFPPDLAGSLRRNAARAGRQQVPEVGIRATMRRLSRPSVPDGFDAVHVVRFDSVGGFLVEPSYTETGRGC